MLRRSLLALALLAVLMGHDHGGCGGIDGDPTEAECDPRLRWDNFGADFMGRYCAWCHSPAAEHRRGAPADHDFDTLAGVQRDLEHVELAAAAGPAAQNDSMPPYGPIPTAFEREQLGRWLACGAP